MSDEAEVVEEAIETPEIPDVLDMSDSDVENMDITSLEAPESSVEDDTDSDDADVEESDESVLEEPEEASEDTDTVYDGETEESTEEVKTEEKSEEESTVDYKQEYEKILAPFRANHKEIKVDSVDDAIALMKMGANYNKKMAGLKPNLKLVKMLDNNGLLDEEKLSYLIDLSKQNPEAINKLIKDSGIDPLDVDTEKTNEYKPNTYTVDDAEVELDQVLSEITETATGKDTLDIVGNKWDNASQKVLVKSPQIIKIINDHRASGVFDKITKVIESERMLGRLSGVTDLEAYKQVGDAIQAQGGFDTQPAKETEMNNPTAKVKEDPKLKDRKKAASSTKRTVSKKSKQSDFNPLSLSDEEFEKIASSQYM